MRGILIFFILLFAISAWGEAATNLSPTAARFQRRLQDRMVQNAAATGGDALLAFNRTFFRTDGMPLGVDDFARIFQAAIPLADRPAVHAILRDAFLRSFQGFWRLDSRFLPLAALDFYGKPFGEGLGRMTLRLLRRHGAPEDDQAFLRLLVMRLPDFTPGNVRDSLVEQLSVLAENQELLGRLEPETAHLLAHLIEQVIPPASRQRFVQRLHDRFAALSCASVFKPTVSR